MGKPMLVTSVKGFALCRRGSVGPPIVDQMRVVLLHALPLTGAMWDEQLAWLPPGTFAPTMYHYGASIDEWASAVIDEVGKTELVVVGASIGGFCALEIARRRPDQVRAIMLVGSKAGVRRDQLQRDLALDLLATEGIDAGWKRWWAPLFGPNAAPAVVERARSLASEVAPGLLANGLSAFYDRPDLSAFVRRWAKPLVVVSGEFDRRPGPATCASLAAETPSGRFRLVPDCGHFVNIEQPRPFNELLHEIVGVTGVSDVRMDKP
jgi:pimeloyl-ACP methyl ester carboxylesterase